MLIAYVSNTNKGAWLKETSYVKSHDIFHGASNPNRRTVFVDRPCCFAIYFK